MLDLLAILAGLCIMAIFFSGCYFIYSIFFGGWVVIIDPNNNENWDEFYSDLPMLLREQAD